MRQQAVERRLVAFAPVHEQAGYFMRGEASLGALGLKAVRVFGSRRARIIAPPRMPPAKKSCRFAPQLPPYRVESEKLVGSCSGAVTTLRH
jgi:hypothetical protein